MAKYTIELRKLCDLVSREEVEKWFKNYKIEEYLTPLQIETINKAGIWNKDKLAKKIVDHYLMREIGFETPELFKHYCKVTMQEIMEYYLPIIYSASIEYDPLVNVDFYEYFDRNIDGSSENIGNSKSISNNQASGLNVNSDTPQGQINKTEILEGKYASNTNASETESSIEDSTDTKNNGTSETNESYTKHQRGNSGISTTAQALIQQYRDIIYTVDKEIIEKLNILFMGLY